MLNTGAERPGKKQFFVTISGRFYHIYSEFGQITFETCPTPESRADMPEFSGAWHSCDGHKSDRQDVRWTISPMVISPIDNKSDVS